MTNYFSKTLAVLIAVLVLFYLPTYQTYKKEEDLAYLNADQTVRKFVDSVRTKGYITPQMYEEFQSELHLGDILYTTEMTHKHKVYAPVYSDAADFNTFSGDYQVLSDEYYETQILDVLYDLSKPEDERIYYLENNDHFSIYVENRTKLKSTMLLEFFTAAIGEQNSVVISIPYGGMVLNEDY